MSVNLSQEGLVLSEAQSFLSDSERLTGNEGGSSSNGFLRDAGGSTTTSWPLVIVFVVGLSIVLVGLPFYNKQVFSRVAQDEGLKKGDALSAVVALVPTIIMLLGACVVLVWVELCRHLWYLKRRGPNDPPRQIVGLFGTISWREKWHYLLIPAVLFAAVMGLTNTSLSLTSVNLHVVLRTSMIVWLVGGAWLVEREVPTLVTVFCCVVLATGAVLVALDPSKSWTGSYWLAILLTALSAVAQAALLIATRRSTRILGTAASLELAAFKALVAALVLLPLAGGLDPGGWARLGDLQPQTWAFLMCGCVVTALFQALLAATQSVTLAISAGVISIFATVPQIGISIAIDPEPLAAIQIVGYTLTPLAAIGYAVERVYRSFRAQRLSRFKEEG